MMFRGTCTILLCLLALVLLPARARAGEWDEATIMHFSQPVEIPGHALPPGNYRFQLLESSDNRNVVEVFDESGMHLIAIVPTIPAYRSKLSGKTVLEFAETRGGSPEALREWFYPGMSIGHEFLYPKLEEREIAHATLKTVTSTPMLAHVNNNVTPQAGGMH
jgi:hypothetical protein